MFNFNLGVRWALSLALIVAAGGNLAARAQSNPDEGYQSNERDSLFGDAPAGLDPIQLLHRTQQLNGRTSAEFEADSSGQINRSALDFKKIQQQRIRDLQQQKSAQTDPETSLETSETVE